MLEKFKNLTKQQKIIWAAIAAVGVLIIATAVVIISLALGSVNSNTPSTEDTEGGIKTYSIELKTKGGKAFDKIEAIIFSMTEEERRHPELIDKDFKRRERIARGSGRSIQEVNKLRTTLDQMKKSMKQMKNMSESDMKRMQSQVKSGNYSGVATPKAKKGKGKGKGSFRY